MTFAVRAMSSAGDMTFGQGRLNFLRDVPAAVGQACGTRLQLWQGEWYLDLTDGTPYWQQILAQKNYALAAAVIRDRILATPFALSLENFSAVFNDATRAFTAIGTLNTAFGPVNFGFPVAHGQGGAFTLGGDPLGPGGRGLG